MKGRDSIPETTCLNQQRFALMTDTRVAIDQLLERDSPGRLRGSLHSTTPGLFCQDWQDSEEHRQPVNPAS